MPLNFPRYLDSAGMRTQTLCPIILLSNMLHLWPCELVSAVVQLQKEFYRAPLPPRPLPRHSKALTVCVNTVCVIKCGFYFSLGYGQTITQIPAFSMRSSWSLLRKLTKPIKFLSQPFWLQVSSTLVDHCATAKRTYTHKN